MKCPHCEYEHGWSGKELREVKGGYGDFFKLPIRAERQEFYSTETKDIYVCPECSKLFAD